MNTVVNWLTNRIKRNGKRVRKIVDDLIKAGYLIQHKKGKTVSLNPGRKKDIMKKIPYRFYPRVS